ncbi:MAG: aminotransferase class I/II-fold pyridoxal phosphate-dependent enzyme, partial [Thermoanaerobaculia bacterium]|nr:aminotransferase class I/II-fold pyridoxal phosphate-dependent enzyme [Thermoanaerobaculia bacterium]
RPSFSLYEHYANVLEARVVGVPVDLHSGALPVDLLIEAARESDGRVVIIVCSPNNPTGSVLREGELEELLSTGAAVILDRAYAEFAGTKFPPIGDRLIVLSTLSKAFGLAGLRIGWLAAAPSTAKEIRKVKLPYNLNIASEEIAFEALQQRDKLLSIIETIIRERDRIASRMRQRDLEVFPSAANFLLFRVNDARAVFDGLLENDVLVRNVSTAPGLENCLRVSVGTRKDNDRFLRVLESLTDDRPMAAGVTA